ncbi:hypothetical protein ACFOD9_03925 [Novosphingobium bradum]|uniref:Globin n=1 Tax=Novosphingobium bradum TaxID=1737444 RepID=A0ABV7IMF5_9SPHN
MTSLAAPQTLSLAEREALMEAALERAAEVIGDLTGPVMERFYARFPEGREAFDRLGLGAVGALEGQMVEQSLFCLMRWLAEPTMIAIMLVSSLPHHQATLGVPVAWVSGMVEEAADLIIETIPADRAGERAVWQAIRAEVVKAIDEAARAG